MLDPTTGEVVDHRTVCEAVPQVASETDDAFDLAALLAR